MNSRGRAGAASVEFAIVGLAFISLLLLALETGWQCVIDSALGAGARAASRFGSTGTTVAAGITPAPPDRNTSIEDILIQNSGGLLQAGQLTITETSFAGFSTACGGPGGTVGPGSTSQVVCYTFTYRQPYLTPIAAAITGNTNLTHTVNVTVLNEPFPSD
jgi:Flp pilus assembly protein TadG